MWRANLEFSSNFYSRPLNFTPLKNEFAFLIYFSQ
jgi:hypothetical protein